MIEHAPKKVFLINQQKQWLSQAKGWLEKLGYDVEARTDYADLPDASVYAFAILGCSGVQDKEEEVIRMIGKKTDLFVMDFNPDMSTDNLKKAFLSGARDYTDRPNGPESFKRAIDEFNLLLQRPKRQN